MIAEKTLQTLELSKILEQLAEHTSFGAGRELALALRPQVELAAARAQQQQTTEARALLEAKPSTHLGGAHDVRPAVRRAEIGSVLTPAELLEIAGTLAASGRVRSAIFSASADLPWLGRQATHLV